MSLAEVFAGGARPFEALLVAWKVGVDRSLLGGLSAFDQPFPGSGGVPCFGADVFVCPLQVVRCQAHAVVGFAKIVVRRKGTLDPFDGFGCDFVALYRGFKTGNSLAQNRSFCCELIDPP